MGVPPALSSQSGACGGCSPGPESSARAPGSHLELLLLEHVGVRGAEDVVRQLGLAVDVDRRGGFAAQELTEDRSYCHRRAWV